MTSERAERTLQQKSGGLGFSPWCIVSVLCSYGQVLCSSELQFFLVPWGPFCYRSAWLSQTPWLQNPWKASFVWKVRGKINEQVDPWGWSVIYGPSFSPRLALISFSERLAGSVGLVTVGCQSPQSYALTDRCSHTHTPAPQGLAHCKVPERGPVSAGCTHGTQKTKELPSPLASGRGHRENIKTPFSSLSAKHVNSGISSQRAHVLQVQLMILLAVEEWLTWAD